MAKPGGDPQGPDGTPISRRLFTTAALATLVGCARPAQRTALVPMRAAPVRVAAPEEPLPRRAVEAERAPPDLDLRPLLRTHPALREKLPFVRLGLLPTPVERAVALGEHLGMGALWVKRDDLSGEVYGGGKVRKLEFLLGEASQGGARTVVTFGGVGSNHAVATAIYAGQLGMHAVLLLLPEPADDHVRQHLLADLGAGAELRPARARFEGMVQQLVRGGADPYVIAPGGSSPLGNVGFVNAAFELADQIAGGEVPEPDVIYLAMGTMGSVVGLALGLRAAGLESRVVAVRASSPGTSSEARMRAMAAETEAYLRGLDPSFPELGLRSGNITIAGGYLGAGYGRVTGKARDAIEVARALGQLTLEHVYTGKALAALIDDAPRLSNRVVLFWNTHNSRELHLLGVDPNDVPPEFRGYFVNSRGAPG
jgi:D-cysteine desulfhydrase